MDFQVKGVVVEKGSCVLGGNWPEALGAFL